jgi:hypothetical protein
LVTFAQAVEQACIDTVDKDGIMTKVHTFEPRCSPECY